MRLVTRINGKLLVVSVAKFEELGSLVTIFQFLEDSRRERLSQELYVNGRGDAEVLTRLCIDVPQRVQEGYEGFAVLRSASRCVEIDEHSTYLVAY